MSKILDLLNYHKRGEEDKKGAGEDLSNQVSSENLDSSIKEKLASTYIFNPVDKDESVNKNPDKKISPHKHDAGTSKIRFIQVFPWIISFLAVLLLLVNIAYRGKINVIIEVAKEGSAQGTSLVSEEVFSPSAAEAEIKAANARPISITLIGEGEFNRYVIKRLGFYGAALSRSKLIQDGFFLYNDGSAGWASVGLDFTEPLDLSNSTLDFFVKGLYGKESLRLFLRDAESNSYLPQADNIIFSKNMAENWQFISIPFNNFNGTYNPRRINHIGFEFGTQTTSNDPGVSIYIKNIRIVKNLTTSYEKTIKGAR